MRITSLPQFKRNGSRFLEITNVLLKYGFADFLDRVEPGFVRRWLDHEDVAKVREMPFAVRARCAAEELGPTFIKLGQVLSTRPDVVPEEVATELARLRSNTPADPREASVAMIEEDLGAPIEELFASFEDEPLASASIAQVYRATTHEGHEVVVKVQHADIEERVESDFEIIIALAELLERYDEDLRAFQPAQVATEARRTLRSELDLRRERRHLQRFRRAFEDDPDVVIPAPFPELSSRRVLTMERLQGVSIAELDPDDFDAEERREIALTGARVFLDMVFEEGIFHADPHPGNILVQPGGRIALLDFGMVGIVDEDLRADLVEMVVAFVRADQRALLRAVERTADVPLGADRGLLRRDLAELSGELAQGDVDELDVSALFGRLTELLRRHRVLLPPSASLLIKLLVMLEGTSRDLDGKFSLVEVLEPYCRRLMRARNSPIARARLAARTSRDWLRLAAEMPPVVEDLVRRVGRGEARIDMVHKGLEATVDRLVSGLLCAAMMLGGSILWALKAPPIVLGIPVVGVAATMLSLVHGLRILIAIRRER